MDIDGYPDDDELATISKWPHNHAEGWRGLLDYVKARWQYADCGYWSEEAGTDILDKPCTKIHASTAGWSGNESIIGALKENVMFWMMCWEQSQRGGHFIFELRQIESR